jgi:hypothetical protein
VRVYGRQGKGLYYVTYDIARIRLIMLRETLHLRSQTYKKSDRQDRRDRELRKVTTSSYTRIITKYSLSVECKEDDLENANAEIRV